MQPDRDYEVGYKKPPKHAQFPKGHSPNPKGRPKGAKTVGTMLRGELNEMVTITENGRRRKITKMQTIMKQVVNDAVKGDAKARKEVLNLFSAIARLEKEYAARTHAASPPGTVILPHNGRDPLDPEYVAACQEAAVKLKTKRQREADRQNPANENQEREVA